MLRPDIGHCASRTARLWRPATRPPTGSCQVRQSGLSAVLTRSMCSTDRARRVWLRRITHRTIPQCRPVHLKWMGAGYSIEIPSALWLSPATLAVSLYSATRRSASRPRKVAVEVSGTATRRHQRRKDELGKVGARPHWCNGSSRNMATTQEQSAKLQADSFNVDGRGS